MSIIDKHDGNQTINYRTILQRYYMIILLVITVTQQIYMPQHHKYLHLALLLIYIVLLDLLKDNVSQLLNDVLFAFAIASCVIVSIVERLYSVDLGIVYLGFLFLAVLLILWLLYSLIIIHRKNDEHNQIKTVHQKMIRRNPSIYYFFLVSLQTVVFLSSIYIIYLIFS